MNKGWIAASGALWAGGAPQHLITPLLCRAASHPTARSLQALPVTPVCARCSVAAQTHELSDAAEAVNLSEGGTSRAGPHPATPQCHLICITFLNCA